MCYVYGFISGVVLEYITAWVTQRLGSDVNKVILISTIGKLTSDKMVSWARDAIKKTGLVADKAVAVLPCFRYHRHSPSGAGGNLATRTFGCEF